MQQQGFRVPPVELPGEIHQRLLDATMELTAKMRAEKSIPDDWRIDVEIAPVTSADLHDNVVRVVATPRPPWNRWV